MEISSSLQIVFNINSTIPIYTPSGSTWILATGFWNDSGVWDDTAVWID